MDFDLFRYFDPIQLGWVLAMAVNFWLWSRQK